MFHPPSILSANSSPSSIRHLHFHQISTMTKLSTTKLQTILPSTITSNNSSQSTVTVKLSRLNYLLYIEKYYEDIVKSAVYIENQNDAEKHRC